MNPSISYALAAVVLLVGPLLGSFAALVATRLPQAARRRALGVRGPGLCSPPSRCEDCGHRLAWFDLLPIVSWLALRGRCRHCGAAIGWHLLGAEIGGLALAPLCLWLVGATPLALALLVFHLLLLCCALAEMRAAWLPESPALVGTVLGLVLAVLPSGWLPGVVPLREALPAAVGGWLLLMAAGWAQQRLRPASGVQAGRGEAALVAMAGAWIGWHALPAVLAVACLLGLLQSLVRGVLRRSDRRAEGRSLRLRFSSFVRGLPPTAFAPALAAAVVIHEAWCHAFHIAF